MNILSFLGGVEIISKICSVKNMSHKVNMHNDTHEILSKLKFIGKIRKGEKIGVRDLSIQPDGIMTTITRSFICVDNRVNTFTFVSDVIRRSFEIINSYIKTDSQNYRKLCINIYSDLVDAIKGITNIKCTYSTDTMFCCSVDTLCDDINVKLAELVKLYPFLTLEGNMTPALITGYHNDN